MALSRLIQRTVSQGKLYPLYPSRPLRTLQPPAHRTHPCAGPVLLCSPDIEDEGEYRCPTNRKQQLPGGKAVDKPRQEHDPHREKAVCQEDGVGPGLIHEPLSDCAETKRTKSRSVQGAQGCPCTQPSEMPQLCLGQFRLGRSSSACS